MNEIDSRDFNKLYSRPPNFCEECGDMLDFQLIFKSEVICQRCGNKTPVEIITNHLIETKDFYHNSKEWKDKLQNIEDKLKVKQELVRSTIRHDCPKCDSKKMYYYTMQLRSADEGSTVFYECVKCKYKYSANN